MPTTQPQHRDMRAGQPQAICRAGRSPPAAATFFFDKVGFQQLATARVTVGPLIPVCRVMSARDNGPWAWIARQNLSLVELA